MIFYRKKHYRVRVLTAFAAALLASLLLFGLRAADGSCQTPMSVGQVILSAKEYSLGQVQDRNGTVVLQGKGKETVWADPQVRSSLEPVMGEDPERSMLSRSTILANCPWVFGTEDNRFRLSVLLNPFSSRKGEDVRLTIDAGLQTGIAQAVEASGFDKVCLVVSNYKTGEILGLYGNIMQDTFHPGSTIKPILAASALSIDPDLASYIYNCADKNHNFSTSSGPFRINCIDGTEHGSINMTDAIAYSCNGYFVSLLQQTGSTAMLKELEKWGFDTVVHYPQFSYTDHSFLGSSRQDCDYLLAGIGQANAKITPIGMNMCTNAILNHGQMENPRWISARGRDGRWTAVDGEGSRQVCSREAADQICKMMLAVTEKGTGRSFALPGFAAKTGTAQKSSESGSLSEKCTVWTTGGLTDEKMPYSVTVCLDDVKSTTTSADAGRLARDILKLVLKGEAQ